MIYLDNNATTRVAPEVFAAMQPYFGELYANPSSSHTFGREMRRVVERAREEVAELLGAREAGEIVFTSCGTESDNWAIRGALSAAKGRPHVVTTLVEHEAVRNLCAALEREGSCDVTWLGVDSEGGLDLDELRGAIRPDTAIVSVMLANNETGVLFPVEKIGRIVREQSGALFHVDGIQAAGKIPLGLFKSEIDLFALSGHKFHAPKGVGALYVRSGVTLPPLLIGGGQERGRRSGTEAVPYIVGLGRAARLAMDSNAHESVRSLRDRLEDAILGSIPNARLNGTPDRPRRLPNTSNISFQYIEGENILAHLDVAGICVSTGSACNSENHIASPVLRAMNIPYTAAQGSTRFSLSRYNTSEEIDETIRILPDIISRLAAMSPYEEELRSLGMS